jgi:putative phage-type endonuclease
MSNIVHPDKEQWLIWRREHVTASDAAAILGENDRRGPLAVYLEKTGLASGPEETVLMRHGRRMESVIADWYAEEKQRPLIDLGPLTVVQHPDLAWLGATLDRMHEDAALGPLEAKAVGGGQVSRWKDDEAPDEYRIQLQIQMACTGAQMGVLAAVLYGVQLAVREEQRHEGFLRAVLPRLEEFQWRVLNKRPPEADATDGTKEALAKAFPNTDGSVVRLDEDALDIADAMAAARVEEKRYKEAAEECRNRLVQRMGAAQSALLPDGSTLSLPLIKQPGYTVEPGPGYRKLSRSYKKKR